MRLPGRMLFRLCRGWFKILGRRDTILVKDITLQTGWNVSFRFRALREMVDKYTILVERGSSKVQGEDIVYFVVGG